MRLVGRHFASHELHAVKPDAAAFDAVPSVTGYAPHRILFFDDSGDNVEAARDAGWAGVFVDHTGDTATQMLATLRSRAVIR